ncbi:MAG: hypothetical protein R2795_11390 [Saprospiraceae bacterium]
MLEALSKPVATGSWKLHLSKPQLLTIADSLMEEVVANPGWIYRDTAGQPLLASVLRATIEALAHIPANERFDADTFRWLLEVNLRTVAANELVLQRIHWGDSTQESAVLQQALTLVFTAVFHRDHVTPGDRLAMLADMLDYILDIIIARHPDRKGLLLTDMILFDSGMLYNGGLNRELANALIDAALDTLAAHPDLISREAALGEIVAGVAGALDASSFKQKDIFPELVRLCLENTALNTRLIVKTTSDQPDFMLVIFLQELLLAISNKDEQGVWQPGLTPAEALIIVDQLVNELIQHPEWIIDGPDGQVIFRDVLQAVRGALRQLPPGVQLTPEHLTMLIALALETAATSEAVLDAIPWGTDTEKRSVLERAMALVATFVFYELRESGGQRLERLAELTAYVLDVVLVYHPDSRGLQLVELVLFGEDDIDYSLGFDEELATEIIESALHVARTHPDLLSNNLGVQQIVSELAAALTAADFRQQGILPRLVQMVLETTADNTLLLIRTEEGVPQYLAAVALGQLLRPLARKDDAGQWQPTLTGEDLLALAETLLDELVQNPHWIIREGKEVPTLWEEVMTAVLDALSLLPKGVRLSPSTLENVLLLSLHTAANSPAVLKKIHWGTETTERAILNTALRLLIAYVYPAGCTPSPDRLTRFLELLDYVLESLIHRYPDKRCLLLMDLLFFESEVDLQQGFSSELAEELTEAALEIFRDYPQLVVQDEIFRKILSDTAGALRASRVPMQHLLPEIFRLSLYYSSGHLERLMRISPNSPRILLAVAIEQVLRVLTAPPARGRWRPTMTEKQLLEVIENVLERVIARPDWVGNDKLIQVTLEALYTAMGELKRGQSLPYETVSFLIDATLDAVGENRQLVLQTVDNEGQQQRLVLEYAVGEVLLTLYDEQGNTAGAWTLTSPQNLHALLSAYLLRLAAAC